MQSITISTRHLRNLVEPVLPFAGGDEMMPVLTGINIKSHGKWLVATATDRFRVAKKRVMAFDADAQPIQWPEFEALIAASTLRSILSTFKGPRNLDPELLLSISDEQLEVEASGGLLFSRASIAYELIQGEFPKVEGIFRKAMKNGDVAAETSFNPAFMADFKNVGGTLRMRRGPGDRDPIFLTDSADFIGLLMPRALTTDTISAPWDDILGIAENVAEIPQAVSA